MLVYERLSFRLYDYQRPRLDTEWLLSTLFDASLLSTSKAAGNGGSFFAPVALAPLFDRPHLSETILTVVAGLSSAPAQ